MGNEISVQVERHADRNNLRLVWIDPISGQKKRKSAKTTDEATAWKAAAKLEEELRAGTAVDGRMAWADFKKRIEDDKLAALPANSRETYQATLKKVTTLLNPDRADRMTTEAVTVFVRRLREAKTKPTTIARHLRHLKAMLRWAKRQRLLANVPEFEMPKIKGQKARSRAITGEEFDRMIDAVPKVRKRDAADWRFLLRGLYLTGLRIGEAMRLSWEPDGGLYLDLTGKRPCLRIDGTSQKSGKDDVVPLMPDAAALFEAVPQQRRCGYVFKVGIGISGQLPSQHACQVISRIGKAARIVTNSGVGKYASAHDLRRAFGTRWAKQLMPAVLKRLMRHGEISTTMAYYVDLDADELAADLWRRFGSDARPLEKSPQAEPAEQKEPTQ